MIVQRLSARRLVQLLGDWRGTGHSYLELSESIALLVRDGSIAVGVALPAERPLAQALGVSRTTVASAYQGLRERGVVHSRQGSGSIVRSQAAPSAPDAAGDDGQIDLSTACPRPWHGLQALGAEAITSHPALFDELGYDTLGRPELRARIAARYTARGLPTTPEQIMVTLGAQHAVFLIARTLLRRGDRTLIESPSYPHAREALAAAGALIGELPVGPHGYDAETMLDIARRTSPRLAYLIPDHHNPTGRSMPAPLRAELIATLAPQGTVILVDETTAELVLGAPRNVLPFAAAAERGHQQDAVVTVGSLGKTVWGGLRAGWIRAAPELIAQLEASRRIGDLGTGSWEQVIAAAALDRYDEILGDRSVELTGQHRLLARELAVRLPEWTPTAAEGGVCTWVDLGARGSSRLSRDAAALGVRLPPGSRFGSPGVFERFTRLPFSLPGDVLVEAIDRLREAWERGSAGGGVHDPGSAVI